MSENVVTWESLDADEQRLLTQLKTAKGDDSQFHPGTTLVYKTNALRDVTRMGLIEKVETNWNGKLWLVRLTPEGRALIPASTDELAALQDENVRLTAENEQLRTEASRRLDVIQQQQEIFLQVLNEENKRLREALAFYADEKNHEEEMTSDGYFWDKSEVWRDEGERARKALEGGE